MICPDCEVEMEDCYIGPEGSLVLHQYPKLPFFKLGFRRRGEEHLGSTWRTLTNLPAHRCRQCKLIVFRYN